MNLELVRNRIDIAKNYINQPNATKLLNELLVFLENKNKDKCLEIVDTLRFIRINNDDKFFIKY